MFNPRPRLATLAPTSPTTLTIVLAPSETTTGCSPFISPRALRITPREV